MFKFRIKKYLKRTDFMNSVDTNKIWSKKVTIPETLETCQKWKQKVPWSLVSDPKRLIWGIYDWGSLIFPFLTFANGINIFTGMKLRTCKSKKYGSFSIWVKFIDILLRLKVLNLFSPGLWVQGWLCVTWNKLWRSDTMPLKFRSFRAKI